MTFEGDAFISYAHIDNIGLVEGHKGWVANLHRALETKVTQRLGRAARIWRDPKLAGNDILSVELINQLRRSVALVSVLTPGYLNSEWCRKELEEFCKAAEEQGLIVVRDKARIFKVLKTPVPRQQLPGPFQPLLGYDFFKLDQATGRVRELDEIFGPDAERDFWLKLDDLAHDLCELLQEAELSAEHGLQPQGVIFLAETTSDLREDRDAIKRDLQQQGYTVLPDQALPLSAPEAVEAIRGYFGRSRMSIHMIGRNYSLVPEGGLESLLEVQHDLAIERGQQGSMSRLVWIPRHLKVTDARQQKLIEQFRMDQRLQEGADLIEASLEELRTAISAALRRQDKQPLLPTPPPSGSIQVYLLYDSRDAEAIGPWSDFLFKDFEVITPAFTGDEADLRLYHEENLRNCDGVMILYGAGNEPWLRRKLAELQKSAGYGRTKPMPEVAICLIPPRTPEKSRFRTHRALVVPQWDGLSPEPLEPFVSALKARAREHQRDGDGDDL